METSLTGRSRGGSLENKEAEATYKVEEAQDLTRVTGLLKGLKAVNLWELSANWAGNARDTAVAIHLRVSFPVIKLPLSHPCSSKNRNKLTTPPS